MTKNCKILQLEKTNIFFLRNFQGLHEGSPKLQEKPSPQKKNTSSQYMQFLNFFLFLWITFDLLDPYLDPQHCFATLLTSVGDPDPDVFGPPGSASISQRYGFGSGSFPFLIKVLSGLK